MRNFYIEDSHIFDLDAIPSTYFGTRDSMREVMQTIPSFVLAEACYYFYRSNGNMDLCNKPIINELEDYVVYYGFKRTPVLIHDIKKAVYEEVARRFFNNTLKHEKEEGWKD